MENLNEVLANVKSASVKLANSSSVVRCGALKNIAELLDNHRNDIKNANIIDIKEAEKSGLSKPMIARLILNDKEIDLMIKSVLEIIEQEEVIGSTIEGVTRPNGLRIEKVRVPLGVVGIIYESRPNVTIDCAALCIKSGNASILRGGKEATNSNACLAAIIKNALEQSGLPSDCVYFVKNQDRKVIGDIASAKGFVDVIIPRGGAGLINYVVDNAKVPVVMHDKGVCHTFIDESADIDSAIAISINAKVQKPSACNAMETLLIHKNIADKIMPKIDSEFKKLGVELKGCDKTLKYIKAQVAIEEDWYTEYLDLTLAVKIVEDINEAIAHIGKYGSHHSDAIITENYSNSQKFLKEVDSAAVYVNASTRFTDGGEFGLGAEVGISTQKLHVRGPMGAKDLTTTKYMIFGSGNIRP